VRANSASVGTSSPSNAFSKTACRDFKLFLRFFKVLYAIVHIAEKLFDFGDYGTLFGERGEWDFRFFNMLKMSCITFIWYF
jgi:hypothetical protein